MFTPEDLSQLNHMGITQDVAERQLARFVSGFPFLRLEAAASVGQGIRRLTPEQERNAIAAWKAFEGTIEKFVPASGAASRMFKNLFAFLNSGRTTPETDFERTFFDNIHRFAFFYQLNQTCLKLHGNNVSELIASGRYTDVVAALLGADGLDYGSRPKALLTFHRAAGHTTHTPVEEHLEEGAQYAATADRKVAIHFTVSPEHRKAFEELLRRVVPRMEQVWGVTYNITLSEQQPATDTIAVTADNLPFRDADGHLVLRPAGHGALLVNLNQRDADTYTRHYTVANGKTVFCRNFPRRIFT